MPNKRFETIIGMLAALVVCVLIIDPAVADDRNWIGGNADWVDNAGNGFWAPVPDEPDSDDVAIFNLNNDVSMGSDNAVEGLTLSGSAVLLTQDNSLDVSGTVSLSGTGTRLGVGGNNVTGLPAEGLEANQIVINSGSTLNVGGTRINTVGAGTSVIDINVGGALLGNGTLRNQDTLVGASTVLFNDGTLSVSNYSTGLIFIGGTPAARTLNITAVDTDARVDLDGVSGAGVVNVFRNQTLDVDVQLTDGYSSDINLFHDSRIDIEDAWTLDGGSLVTVDNGFVPGSTFPIFFPEIPAGNATIAGGTLTQTSGTIDLVDTDGTLTFEADFVGNGGTLDNSASGTVVFQGTTTINDAHTYTQGANSQTIIDGGTTTINDDGLVLDGTSNSDWTVTNGGRLNVRSAALNGATSNVFNGDLVFDGGVIDVNVDGTSWTSNNEIRSESGGTLIGDRILIGNDSGTATADLDINGGTLVIEAPVSLLSDARVNVAAGSTLLLNSPNNIVLPVNGAQNGVFTGTGTFRILGAQFDEATTFDFSGGTVGLDGLIGNNSTLLGLFPPAADTDLNADLTINAATFDDFGTTGAGLIIGTSSFSDLNIADSATLTINLDDANGAWTVLSNGIINYQGIGGANNFLAGSDVNMNGTLNVNADGRTNARLDIGGTVNITTIGGFLRLNASGDTHTIDGGIINGPGRLFSESNDSLSGNGTISADVDFNGTSELIASGGLLDINGAILDVHTLRSNGAAAVLDLQNAFNSNVTSNGISLSGGARIQGNTITLSTRNLRGNGTVLNQVINDNTVAAQGGTLVLDNSTNNWDGSGNAGILRAQSGNLTLRDNAGFGFNGTVRADVSRTVFADGFHLQMNSGSTLDLNGGTFRSTNGTRFFGSIDAIAGQTSTIDTPTSIIQSTANVQVNGNLNVIGNSTIEAGATFAGGGRLVNVSGTMTADNSANLGVFVENRGTFSPASGIGRADMGDYLQTATGSLDLDVDTAVLGGYDRVIVGGNAQLAGNIELTKNNANALTPYSTVAVLTATSGVAGTFDTVTGVRNQPTFSSGEGFAVTYESDRVNVTRAKLGDLNLDGDVDVTELIFGGGAPTNVGDASVFLSNLGTASGATWSEGDLNGDGDVDVSQLIFSGGMPVNVGDGSTLLANLGADAGDGEAAAYYDSNGDVIIDLTGTGVMSFSIASLTDSEFDLDSLSDYLIPNAFEQRRSDNIAYLSLAGFNEGVYNLGSILGQGQSLASLNDYVFSYTVGGRQAQFGRLNAAAVPEPGSVALMLAGLSVFSRRRRLTA